jgi:uncharacterized protein
MPDNQSSTNLKEGLSVMITGGSGLVGKYLTSLLLSEGFKVTHLSRKTGRDSRVRVCRWDPEKSIIDPSAFEGINYLIHLAGANIGEKRWTKKRKEEIIKSRVESARFLHKIIIDNGILLNAFISASAVGYYGSVTSDRIFREEDNPADDFLGITCRLWEEAVDLFEMSGTRTVKIRAAVVLEKSDSALSKMMKPGKYGFLVKTGNGRQYMPWIHIADLCGIYLKAIRDYTIKGPYNAVSPHHVTHGGFMSELAAVLNLPHFMPAVPSFVIKAVLGEMSDVILKGSRVSSEKIINAGYRFKFDNLHDALSDVIFNQKPQSDPY